MHNSFADCSLKPLGYDTKKKSGKRGSNSRHQPWQGCALPTELFPLRVTKINFNFRFFKSEFILRINYWDLNSLSMTVISPGYVIGPRKVSTVGVTPSLTLAADPFFPPRANARFISLS